MQAIVTKFHGPTNFKGSRITAQCEAGRITIGSPSDMNPEDGHTFAAVQLVKKLGWDQEAYGGTLIRGGMPQKSPYSYVFVFSGNATVDYDTVTIGDNQWND